MQAITYQRYGGPEVLNVREVPSPQPKADEILVRVHAAEASKTDTEMRSFHYSVKWLMVPMRLALGVFRPRRPILGIYFAGEVESVGSEVAGFEPGDAIYGSSGLRRGAYGELMGLPAKAVIAPKPTTMTYAEAAAVPLGAINALHFLRKAKVQPGERVLVNGAGGVIGAYTVQLARAMGAEVTGVDAARKEAFVRAQGASEFVDYQQRDITTVADCFDVILDMVPTSSVPAMLDLLNAGGRYAHGNPKLSTMLRAPVISRRTDKRVIVAFADESRSVLTELAAMIDRGELTPIVDRVLPMESAPEAHALVDSEERLGAIVLAIGPKANER